VDYTEQLRSLAVNDARFVERINRVGIDRQGLDPKSLALVRLGGLVAAGGAVPSYGELSDAGVRQPTRSSTSWSLSYRLSGCPALSLPHRESPWHWGMTWKRKNNFTRVK
jgi:hypothetical protein